MDTERPAPPEPHLARNLSILRNSKDSVAKICRRIGISRQKFNKRRSDKREPSRGMRHLIGQYCGLDVLDLGLESVRLSTRFVNKSYLAIGIRARD